MHKVILKVIKVINSYKHTFITFILGEKRNSYNSYNNTTIPTSIIYKFECILSVGWCVHPKILYNVYNVLILSCRDSYKTRFITIITFITFRTFNRYIMIGHKFANCTVNILFTEEREKYVLEGT